MNLFAVVEFYTKIVSNKGTTNESKCSPVVGGFVAAVVVVVLLSIEGVTFSSFLSFVGCVFICVFTHS